jgi:hypothetical protein
VRLEGKTLGVTSLPRLVPASGLQVSWASLQPPPTLNGYNAVVLALGTNELISIKRCGRALTTPIGIQECNEEALRKDEQKRESFLARFTNATCSVGLAVLGGIFAEGIDLPGEQLVGVTVIGVGRALRLRTALLHTAHHPPEHE